MCRTFQQRKLTAYFLANLLIKKTNMADINQNKRESLSELGDLFNGSKNININVSSFNLEN